MQTCSPGLSAIIALLIAASAWGADSNVAPLADAVQRQDTPEIRALLDQHADINGTLADGSTALLWAAHWDDAALVDLLLAAGAKPGAANRYGISPLLEACMNGNAAVIEKLLKAGADVNTAQPEGETALMTAARTGSMDAVTTLLDHGARIDVKENWRGQSALMWAAAERHSAVVRLLIERGADVNARSRIFDFTGLMPKQGSVPMNYPRGGFTALLFAARQGDLASGQALVNATADVNLADPDGISPLIEAIVNFHFDFAAFLLDHGADPNARDNKGRSPLYAAVDMHSLDTSTRPNPVSSDKFDSLDLIKALLARGAKPNLPLTDLIPPRGPLDVADYTLGAGATPFLRAAKSDDLEVMRLLLDKGADPLLATKEGVTPLMAAAGAGWRDGKSHGAERDAIEAIKLCLDHGADINALTGKGQSALNGASLRGADTVIAYLMSRGAGVNPKDKIVQTFSAKVSALGTSTSGLAPSVPASLACQACSGTLTATSSAPWLIITSTAGGSIGFNVLSNTSTEARTAVIQVEGASNKVTLTIEQEGSTAPVLNRQVTYLYQHTLGREPDAAGFNSRIAQGPAALGRLAADLLDRAEAKDSDFAAMAMYQAINGFPPEYSNWLTVLQVLRNGETVQSQFTAIFTASPCAGSPRAAVNCLYNNMLGRTPTAPELSVAVGEPPFLLFRSIFGSPEFQSRQGFTVDHTNSLCLTLLYYLVLERAPDESELARGLNVANAGGPGSCYSPSAGVIPGIVGALTGTAGFVAKFQ